MDKDDSLGERLQPFCILSDGWITFLPCLVTMEAEKTKLPRAVEATVLSLKTTQNLEVVRANAADSDVQAMEVSTLCGLCNIAFAQEKERY